MRRSLPTRRRATNGTVPGEGARGRRIAVHVIRSGEGWDVVLPENERHVTCETLDDARRVAYLYGAHARPCELIVHEGGDRIHSELLGAIAPGS
jgi:hypothetical protein